MRRYWIPIGLSVSRLVLAPFVAYLFYTGNFELGLILYLIAVFTDILDGLAARLLKAETRLGAFLDQFADKILNGSALVAFIWSATPIDSEFLAVVAITIILDLVLLGLRILGLIMRPLSYNPESTIFGKLKMTCQFYFIFGLVFAMTPWFPMVFEISRYLGTAFYLSVFPSLLFAWFFALFSIFEHFCRTFVYNKIPAQ